MIKNRATEPRRFNPPQKQPKPEALFRDSSRVMLRGLCWDVLDLPVVKRDIIC